MVRIACFVVFSLSLHGAQAGDTLTHRDIERLASTSRAAVKELGSTLKAQLVTAIKSDGPASAIPVCNVAAPSIAKSVSKTVGGNVGRTALKLRNPKNAPDTWETAILEKFIAQIDAGAEPQSLEHFEVVTNGGKSNFRYMKSIVTGKPCLACHGPNVAPSLRKTIRDLYPDDDAVGFTLGSLRGAFTVTLPVK